MNEFRLYFTEKYAEELNNIIKNKPDFLKNELYKNDKENIPEYPRDFELAKLLTLNYGCINKLKLSYKLSYNKDREDKGNLEDYKKARDKLSHIHTLKYEELEEIIKIFEKKVR